MISDEDMKTLFSSIKEERPDFYRVYVFMLRTGRRVEEVTLILRKNVIIEKGKFKELYVRAEDVKMERSSYLDIVDDEFEELLWDACQDSDKHKSPYLFLTRKHKKCDQRKLCDYLKKKSQQLLGVAITNHYFRHRFLTDCGRRRFQWSNISKISGLKDQKVYMDHYDHATPEGQRKVFALTKGIA
jgi:integrase